jgi:hypothetical protein
MRNAIWEPQYTPTLPGSQETGFLPAVSLSRNVTSARKGKLISVSETTNTRIAYLAGVAVLQASTLCTSVATIFTTCFHAQYVIISPRMYSNIPFHSHKKQQLLSKGRAMAQEVTRRPSGVETQVRARFSPYGICGG